MQMLQVGYQDHDVALGGGREREREFSFGGCLHQRGWHKVNYLLWCLGSKLSFGEPWDLMTWGEGEGEDEGKGGKVGVILLAHIDDSYLTIRSA